MSDLDEESAEVEDKIRLIHHNYHVAINPVNN